MVGMSGSPPEDSGVLLVLGDEYVMVLLSVEYYEAIQRGMVELFVLLWEDLQNT